MQALTNQATRLRERALELLEHIEDQTSNAYCIASAGRAFADDNLTEKRLFSIIEDTLCVTSSRTELARIVKELASLVEEVRHA